MNHVIPFVETAVWLRSQLFQHLDPAVVTTIPLNNFIDYGVDIALNRMSAWDYEKVTLKEYLIELGASHDAATDVLANLQERVDEIIFQHVGVLRDWWTLDYKLSGEMDLYLRIH